VNTFSLAYTLAALCYLCPEAERYARSLHLDCPSFYDRHNFRFSAGGEKERLLGELETKNYALFFREDGCLHEVLKLHMEQYHTRMVQMELARQRSDIDAQGAYDLALQWLNAVDVDTNRLVREYDYKVTNPEVGGGSSKKIVPDFWIKWIKKEHQPSKAFQMYGVEVEILGPGAQLMRLDVEARDLSLRNGVRISGESVLMQLPNDSFTNIWTSRELSVSNVYDTLHTSTAYEGVVLSNMLAEADWTLHKLRIPETVRPEQLRDSFVAPPEFGLRGCLETEHCFFQFDEFGGLSYLVYSRDKLLSSSTADNKGYYEEKEHLPGLVNSNSVIILAKDFLKALDVDVVKLDSAATPLASRYNFARNRPSQLWWVNWWNPEKSENFAYVEVDGTTRTPNRIKILDRKFCRRAGSKVDEASVLMATPDPQRQRDPLRAHLNVWPHLFPSNSP
jgi:hypothetical protein